MTEQQRPRAGARAAIWAINGYQASRAGQISPCRFTPSCSAYAAEAIETYGLVKGGFLAVRRVLRCNPFGGHGVDLVPLETGAHR